MKRPAFLLVLVLASTAASAAGESVSFPGPGLELEGRLYRPEGPGPFPAIVLLHGCSGMWRRDGREPTASYSSWAEHWRTQGFVAILVDSFGPRGEREICTHKVRAITPDQDRPRDAYAALRWLASRPDVREGHVHLMGWSNGAMAVLNTVNSGAPGRPAEGAEFRSAVAFYPGCVQVLKQGFRPRVPLLIQSGAADNWTLAKPCEELARESQGKGAAVEIDVYPEAHHGFDGVGATVRTRPDVRNPNSPSGWGATVGRHPVARARAITRATEWVRARDR